MTHESRDGHDQDVPEAAHNAEVNTAAAEAELCGMTHLATGRICLLPRRHPNGCDFREEGDVDGAISLR
jgi:hypothetical protein